MDRKLLIENAIADLDRKASTRQREAGELYLRARTGDMAAKHKLIEGISTSDLPAMLAPAINVEFLANYANYPTVWQSIVDEVIESPTLGNIEFGGFDLSTQDLLGDHDGDTYVGIGLPGVGEYGEYPAINFTTEQLSAELRKNGVRLRISWEAIINSGRIDIIGRSTSAFARYAAEQEDVKLAKEFVSTAGVINSAFTTVTGNPTLSLEALQNAKAQGAGITVGGRPAAPASWTLVTTPGLSETAAQLLAITQVRRTDASTGDEYDMTTGLGNVNAVSFAALASVGNYTTPGTVDDNWFLVGRGGARPAFAEVFLEGYRTPLISIKDSGHFTLGGGAVPSREGNFEVDDVETRGRHVVGAATIAPEIVLASDGSGA